jgi:hypothetical protein
MRLLYRFTFFSHLKILNEITCGYVQCTVTARLLYHKIQSIGALIFEKRVKCVSESRLRFKIAAFESLST